MDIKRVVCGLYQENAYVVNGSVLIDPGDDYEALLQAAPEAKAILLTHGHFDHMLACEKLQQALGIPVYVHQNDAPMLTDAGLCAYNPAASVLPMPENVRHEVYSNEICGLRVIHAPGHTRGSVCLYSEDEGILFSGDTLFRAGYGRTDLPGGNMADMVSSLMKLFDLPGAIRVLPGHGEETTIAIERRRYGK